MVCLPSVSIRLRSSLDSILRQLPTLRPNSSILSQNRLTPTQASLQKRHLGRPRLHHSPLRLRRPPLQILLRSRIRRQSRTRQHRPARNQSPSTKTSPRPTRPRRTRYQRWRRRRRPRKRHWIRCRWLRRCRPWSSRSRRFWGRWVCYSLFGRRARRRECLGGGRHSIWGYAVWAERMGSVMAYRC